MAKLKPTVAEVKQELQIDFPDDDALIERYIDASADSVYAELHWIKSSPYKVSLHPSRFVGANPIKIPVRGVANTDRFAGVSFGGRPVNTQLMRGFMATVRGVAFVQEQSITVKTIRRADIPDDDSAGIFLDFSVEPNRYIAYLVPSAYNATWSDVFESIEAQYSGGKFLPGNITLSLAAADAPQIILTAISKMAVDCYKHTGVGMIPMQTAVARMLDPIRDHGYG